jgi:hypothetical protein
MDLTVLREYLIQKGIPPEELDEIKEPKVVKDLGEVVVVTLQNDNQLGELVMSLFFQVNDLAMMVMQQQMEIESLKNGGNV